MSLVERAAKRLEELGKAGVQAAGDLTYRPSEGQVAPTLIERAVRGIETFDEQWNTHGRIPPAIQPPQAPDSPSFDDPTGTDRAHLDSGLEGTNVRGSGTSSQPFRAHSASRQGQRVELDLSKLASAGFLQPESSESQLANEFRKIKRPLIKACQGKSATPIQNANRIMVTSSIQGEGKTFVSLNLALSIAMERDSTVLLIDADTTRPGLSRLAGLASKPGLLDLLAGGSVEVSDALFRTNIDRLSLLPAGTGQRQATELLASAAMEQLVQHLASRYPDRILIFDAPPLLGAPEPAVLASHMGQIIVVVEADRTMHKVLTKALTTIQSCPVVTTVLNQASSPEQGYFYAG